MAEVLKACRNPGCKQKYNEEENHEEACNHHSGKPIFHDLKKGWTCCNQIAWDWDEFEKLKPCAKGRHTHVDPFSAQTGQDQFYKSNTVTNAKNALDKEEAKPKTIEEYNKEQEELKKKKEAEAASQEKKIFVTPSGKHKCTNKGCLKEFDPNENNDEACKYHPGEPVFHDVKKTWTCCKVETWDWDDFMKIVPCTSGKHIAKLV